ncbi:MAG: sensor histidine kinase, partial [Anaerolineae bacterium]
SSGSLQIVLIEDNPGDSDLILEYAQGDPARPITVRAAATLAAGIRLCATGPVDLVMSDLNLPDSMGMDTFESVHRAVPDAPIVVITGNDDDVLAAACISRGAQDYLIKNHINRSLPRTLWNLVLRIRAESDLRITKSRNLDRLSRIVNKSSDGIIIAGHDDLILFANPAAETLLGRTAQDLLGTEFGFSLDEGSSEVSLSQPNGETVTIEMNVENVEWDDANAFLVLLHDISRYKKILEEEKRLTRMKDEVVSSVSHELRTPLHAIKGFLSLLLRGKVPDVATQKEFLGRASGEVDRLATLLDEVLDVSRLAGGYINPELYELDLDELVVRPTVESLEALAQERGCSIKHHPSPTQLIVISDQRRLRQVLTNMLGNAIKFSPAGKPVEVKTVVDGDWAKVTVSDHGIGIPKESISKLFARFYQAENSKIASGGAGLGLHISMELMKSLGGNLTVESVLNQGSTFTVCIPINVDSPTT